MVIIREKFIVAFEGYFAMILYFVVDGILFLWRGPMLRKKTFRFFEIRCQHSYLCSCKML